MFRDLLSALAIGLTFVAFFPYIAAIMRRQIRPHVFSWLIWGMTTGIVCLAQLADGAGVGAWPIGVSGVVTLGVAGLSFFRHGDVSATRTDWIFLCAAIASMPAWYLVSDPLAAVLILTAIDLLGFGPTFRSAYQHPHQEQLTFYGVMAARNGVSVAALENVSFTTAFFPLAVAGACIVFITMVMRRRCVVSV